MKKAVFNWSGGKDSSLALHYVLEQKEYDPAYLLTSLNKQYNRISMHGVRMELAERQAESINIPLRRLEVPEMPSMEDYNRMMRETLLDLKEKGIEHSIFGDIFLEDLKEYREGQLEEVGIQGVFPIWLQSTDVLVKDFIQLGFKAIIVCINNKHLDKSFVGREIDQSFLDDLPDDVDPCGENGEFHSFVYDGPIFSKPIPVKKGEVVYKEYKPCDKEKKENDSYEGHDDVFDNGFWYCDLLLDEKASCDKIAL